jgi:hypothetical protein
VADFDEAMKYNDQIKAALPKVQDDLNPIRVLELFEQISHEDTELLDCYYRPEHLIMQDLPVPPVCIRPSVEMDSAAGRCDPPPAYSDAKVANRNEGFRVGDRSRGRMRRPPISLHTIVARTGGYAYDVGGWDLSIVQGPFSVAPCQTLETLALRFATFSSLYSAPDDPLHACVG